MLTQRQHDLLVYINGYISDHGISPSYDDMRAGLGLRSKSGIHRLISALVERGFLRRMKNRARALEVLKLPDSAQGRPGPGSLAVAASGYDPFAGGGGREAQAGETISVPLLGRIAAGTPITALSDYTTTAEVPRTMISGVGHHFALQVEGDSMQDAGIFDGDLALFRQCEDAENGTVVIALIEREEATLKRLRKRGDRIALEPANEHYETRIYGPDQVDVQGRLVGLLRMY